MGECVYSCNGNDYCEFNCLESFKIRQEKCTGVCRCEDYECFKKPTALARTTTTVSETPPISKAVLILPVYGRAVVADFDGKKNDFQDNFSKFLILFKGNWRSVDFRYSEGAQIETSGCATTLHGQFWYFGGSQSSESLVRQVRINRYCHIDIGDECCRFHQQHCHQSQLNNIIRHV